MGRGGREAEEGGGVCMHMADSCCCIAETNTTLQSNYSPIKNKKLNSFLKKKKRLGPLIRERSTAYLMQDVYEKQPHIKRKQLIIKS